MTAAAATAAAEAKEEEGGDSARENEVLCRRPKPKPIEDRT